MKIAFYSTHLCLHGTTVAVYDYANYNESILGNESFVFYLEDEPRNNETTKQKFKNRFGNRVISGRSIEDIDSKLKDLNIDAIYVIKTGRKDDGVIFKNCPMLINAVGLVPPSESHGKVFAYNSYWVSQHCSNGSLPAVPHMIDLPEVEDDLRNELNIPSSAIVFGRNGGTYSWNINFVEKSISEALNQRDEIFFVFQNTPRFLEHERIINIPPTADMEYKVKFINTCDAMIHARKEGESFGLTCGEFSVKNKPVITWDGSAEKNHTFILGEKGIYYKDQSDLTKIFLSFKPNPNKDWNAYKDYSPEKIMKIFNEVYLQNV
jgi:hypothetical protein